MAFKMKGSAFKLNNVATKSALQQTSPMKDTQSWGFDSRTGGWDSDWGEKDTHNKRHERGDWNKDHKTKKEVEYEKEGGGKGMDKELGLDRREEAEGGPKMKSPLEQDERPWYKKAWDEATQIGKGIANMPYKGSYGGSPDPFGSRFMEGYNKEEAHDALSAKLGGEDKLINLNKKQQQRRKTVETNAMNEYFKELDEKEGRLKEYDDDWNEIPGKFRDRTYHDLFGDDEDEMNRRIEAAQKGDEELQGYNKTLGYKQ